MGRKRKEVIPNNIDDIVKPYGLKDEEWLNTEVDLLAQETQIKNIRKKIVSAMKNEGTYNPLFDFAIDTLAQTQYVQTLALQKIDKHRLVDVEATREGNVKRKTSPEVDIFREFTETSRKLFVELGMTARTVSSSEDDDVDKLTEKIRNA